MPLPKHLDQGADPFFASVDPERKDGNESGGFRIRSFLLQSSSSAPKHNPIWSIT